MNKTSNRPGFTLVEFSLATAFISVLLVALALIIQSITVVYQKGLTLKSVNSAGADIVDELSRTITSAPLLSNPKALCAYVSDDTQNTACKDGDNPGYKLIFQHITAPSGSISLKQLASASSISEEVSIGGVFCTGKYSYVWNTGYVLNKSVYDSSYDPFQVKSGSGTLYTPRFLRIKDPMREACSYTINNDEYNFTALKDPIEVSAADDDIVDLLEISEDNLAIYDLRVFYPRYHSTTQHGFYSGTFILATLTGGVDVTASGEYCTDSPALSFSSDFPYCALNKFNFASRATGEE